jgi:hypothetical protein
MGIVSQFLPHNSATLQFQVLMSLQMDAELKEGADWYPFCLGGGTGRGVWGVGGPSGVSTPKSIHAIQKNKQPPGPGLGLNPTPEHI